MTLFHITVLILAAVAATATVLTRDPVRQSMVYGLYGLILTVLFFSLQAPDVAFSELVVGTAAIPLLILITVYKTREAGR